MNPSRLDRVIRCLSLVAVVAFAACAHSGAAGPAAATAPGGGPVAGPAAPAAETRAVGVDGATEFLSGISRCGSIPPVITAREAREQPEGTAVAVRGVLLHTARWDCPAKACKSPDGHKAAGAGACCNTCHTRWFIVDQADAARPYMSRARLYVRGPGQQDLMTLEAQDCDVAKVNAATPARPIVVTGTFQGSAGEGGGSQLIENARLCMP